MKKNHLFSRLSVKINRRHSAGNFTLISPPH